LWWGQYDSVYHSLPTNFVATTSINILWTISMD